MVTVELKNTKAEIGEYCRVGSSGFSSENGDLYVIKDFVEDDKQYKISELQSKGKIIKSVPINWWDSIVPTKNDIWIEKLTLITIVGETSTEKYQLLNMTLNDLFTNYSTKAINHITYDVTFGKSIYVKLKRFLKKWFYTKDEMETVEFKITYEDDTEETITLFKKK